MENQPPNIPNEKRPLIRVREFATLSHLDPPAPNPPESVSFQDLLNIHIDDLLQGPPRKQQDAQRAAVQLLQDQRGAVVVNNYSSSPIQVQTSQPIATNDRNIYSQPQTTINVGYPDVTDRTMLEAYPPMSTVMNFNPGMNATREGYPNNKTAGDKTMANSGILYENNNGVATSMSHAEAAEQFRQRTLLRKFIEASDPQGYYSFPKQNRPNAAYEKTSVTAPNRTSNDLVTITAVQQPVCSVGPQGAVLSNTSNTRHIQRVQPNAYETPSVRGASRLQDSNTVHWPPVSSSGILPSDCSYANTNGQNLMAHDSLKKMATIVSNRTQPQKVAENTANVAPFVPPCAASQKFGEKQATGLSGNDLKKAIKGIFENKLTINGPRSRVKVTEKRDTAQQPPQQFATQPFVEVISPVSEGYVQINSGASKGGVTKVYSNKKGVSAPVTFSDNVMTLDESAPILIEDCRSLAEPPPDRPPVGPATAVQEMDQRCLASIEGKRASAALPPVPRSEITPIVRPRVSPEERQASGMPQSAQRVTAFTLLDVDAGRQFVQPELQSKTAQSSVKEPIPIAPKPNPVQPSLSWRMNLPCGKHVHVNVPVITSTPAKPVYTTHQTILQKTLSRCKPATSTVFSASPETSQLSNKLPVASTSTSQSLKMITSSLPTTTLKNEVVRLKSTNDTPSLSGANPRNGVGRLKSTKEASNKRPTKGKPDQIKRKPGRPPKDMIITSLMTEASKPERAKLRLAKKMKKLKPCELKLTRLTPAEIEKWAQNKTICVIDIADEIDVKPSINKSLPSTSRRDFDVPIGENDITPHCSPLNPAIKGDPVSSPPPTPPNLEIVKTNNSPDYGTLPADVLPITDDLPTQPTNITETPRSTNMSDSQRSTNDYFMNYLGSLKDQDIMLCSQCGKTLKTDKFWANIVSHEVNCQFCVAVAAGGALPSQNKPKEGFEPFYESISAIINVNSDSDDDERGFKDSKERLKKVGADVKDCEKRKVFILESLGGKSKKRRRKFVIASSEESD